jgi:glycine betaine/proline transport system substrate-binding protein
MNATLAYMADQQATGEDAAVEFLSKHGDVWTSWVTSDAAKKIKAGL